MSVYRTEPGVVPVRIHSYPNRRPNSIRDARMTSLTENTEPTPQQLEFDLSYAEFLMLIDERASVSA